MSVPSSEPSAASPMTPDREPAADQSAFGQRAATAFAAATPGTRRSHHSRSSVPRLPPDALEPLCQYVDFQRRLELAARELRARLAQLPAARWRIEPYPLTGERRNTFVILGETGVFVVSATYAPGHWDDVSRSAGSPARSRCCCPATAEQVQPAICHPFTHTPTSGLASRGRARRLGRRVAGRRRLA